MIVKDGFQLRSLIVFSATLLALSSVSHAQSVTVTRAEIDNGLLIVEGNTSPSTTVVLDGTYQRNSNAVGRFRFRLNNYHPGDCVIDLVVGSTTTPAVVSDCGPGFRYRGQWSAARSYNANDVVLHRFSTWRAQRANTGVDPVGNGSDWILMARRGGKGAAGAQGPQGVAGADGAVGPQGPQGLAGADGAPGAPGAIGPAGPKGDTGAVGSEGSAG